MIPPIFIVPPLTMSIDICSLAYNKIKKKSNPHSSLEDIVKPPVTVIISAHKREKTIEKSIREMFNQTYPIKNIYISDSNLDNTREVVGRLEKEFPNLYYWSKEGITSKSEKINNLVRDNNVDLGDLVYLKDSSAVPNKDILEKLVPAFSESNVAAVTSFGYVNAPKNYLAKYFHYGKEWINRMGRFRKNAQEIRRGMYVVCGASFMARADILKKLEIPTGTKTEDTAYTWRLQEEGYKVRVVQDAIVSSDDVNSLGSQLKQTYRWYTGSWQNLFLHGRKLFNPKSKGANLGYSTVLPGFLESSIYCGTMLSLPLIYHFYPEFAKGFVIADTALTLAAPLISMPLIGKTKEIPKEIYKTVRHLHQITSYKLMSSGLWFCSGARTLYDVVSGKSKEWNSSWKKVY